MNSKQVPQHLVEGARTGFLDAAQNTSSQWKLIAEQFDLDGRDQDLVDLGAAPMPVEDKSGVTMQDFVERALQVQIRSWNLTLGGGLWQEHANSTW